MRSKNSTLLGLALILTLSAAGNLSIVHAQDATPTAKPTKTPKPKKVKKPKKTKKGAPMPTSTATPAM